MTRNAQGDHNGHFQNEQRIETLDDFVPPTVQINPSTPHNGAYEEIEDQHQVHDSENDIDDGLTSPMSMELFTVSIDEDGDGDGDFASYINAI